MVVTPEVNGRSLTFFVAGTYNAMVLIGDRETGSWWDHITGECVNGPLMGSRLAVSPLLHSTAGAALAAHPDARIAIGRQSLFERSLSRFFDWARRSAGRFLILFAKSTMGKRDERLPRWEIGLGVWSESGAVYYPSRVIRENGRALIDRFDGRQMLVYLDQRSDIPAAVFIEGQTARWEKDRIILADGLFLRDGTIRDPGGSPLFTHRPMQLFSRWFGFSLTFQNCSVYGEDRRSA